MNICQPFLESGNGMVYCPECLEKLKKESKKHATEIIGHCPFCGSDNVEYGAIEVDEAGLQIFYPMVCNVCLRLSREYYDIEYRETVGV